MLMLWGPSYAIAQAPKPKHPTSKRAQEVAGRVRPVLEKALAVRGLRIGDPVYLRIFKESDELELWVLDHKSKTYHLFRTYEIAAYSGKAGPKLQEGDRQAPEGFYYVPASRLNPNSRFHLAFDLGYPNTYDQSHDRTGSFLMVHGSNVSIGCFAMTDARIEEIYTLVDAALRSGQHFVRVHCFSFKLTEVRMAKADVHRSKWLPFWQNLKQGYDWFESRKLPPEVKVRAKRYVFE